MRIQGFEGPEYQGKKVRKFNLAADIPEQDLIKDSNYFDESNGALGIKSTVPTKYADFRMGDMNQLSTFAVKTYMYDVNLSERITAG